MVFLKCLKFYEEKKTLHLYYFFSKTTIDVPNNIYQRFNILSADFVSRKLIQISIFSYSYTTTQRETTFDIQSQGASYLYMHL